MRGREEAPVGGGLGDQSVSPGGASGRMLPSNTSAVLQRQGMGEVVGRKGPGNQRAVSDVLTVIETPIRRRYRMQPVLDTRNGMTWRRVDHGGL